MIVIDASALLEVLFGTDTGAVVAHRLGDEAIAAPQLLILECLQVMHRFEGKGALTSLDATEMVDDLMDVDVDLYDHRLVAKRVWELRANLTAYDAAYVALAELLGVALVTTDAKLANAPGHGVAVELIPLR